MWFEQKLKQYNWKTARRKLRQDPVLRKIIEQVGPCTLRPRRDYFVVLCKSIFTQQISTAVAAKLYGRFSENFPGRRPTPLRVIKLLNGDGEAAKLCGLSRQKCSYLLDLSHRFASGQLPTRRLSRMSDQQIIECLIQVHGVGRWTAEMFLIFVLNRPDVLPVDDLGLRDAVRRFWKLPERPDRKKLQKIAERWQPWRSVATWYLWRGAALIPK